MDDPKEEIAIELVGVEKSFGAEGVSRTTTDAVVLSSVTILVWDYLISAIML